MYLNANTIVLAYTLFCQHALLKDCVISFKDFQIQPTILPALACNMDNAYKLLHECFAPALSGIQLLEAYEDQVAYELYIHQEIESAYNNSFKPLLQLQQVQLHLDQDRKYIFNYAVKLAIDQAMLNQEYAYTQMHPFTFYQQLHKAWLIHGFHANNYKFVPQKYQLVPKAVRCCSRSTEQVKKLLFNHSV